MRIPMRTLGCLLVLASLAASQPSEGMFDLYARNRTANRPNYITEDFLLLSHMMILERASVDFERLTAMPALSGFARDLSARLQKEQGTAKIARDFAAILAALTEHAAVASSAADPEEAAAELGRIYGAKGIEHSLLFRQDIDYSQFRPRGHYTQSPALTNYFLAYRFAGAILFPVLESRATGITADDADLLTGQALAMARAIATSQELSKSYAELTTRFTFWFGPADDLTLEDYTAIASSATPQAARAELLALGKRPRIVGRTVDAGKLEKGRSVKDVLTGFRLMPQRFSADSGALGELVFPNAGAFQGTGTPFTLGDVGGRKVKAFPTARELMALLGSKAAQGSLEKDGSVNYADYATAKKSAQHMLEGAEGLPGSHLQLMRAWLGSATPANGARRLRSALAYWTYYRYGGLLYIKQSYTAEGKGLTISSPRPGAWLEPVPELYLLLLRQAALLSQQGPNETLKSWQDTLSRCIDISYAELQQGKPDANHEAFLNGLDETLLKLTGKPDRPIVVDIHTEPNSGMVVEEGIAFPAPVKAAGKAAAGALFSPREFKQPLSERLNDEEWITRLREEKPAAPVAPSAMPPATSRPTAKPHTVKKDG
jgi:hypothetical protein